jgi:hypothetical protein
MMEDELDRMLATRDEIVPSSGFVASVMDAVHREAAASEPTPFPPLAFPWLRALPIFIALAAVAAMLIALFIHTMQMPAAATQAPLLPPVMIHALVQVNAGWIAAALALAFFSAFFSVRFAIGKR